MKHPYKKFFQLQLLMMIFTLLLGIVAMVKGSLLLIVTALFCLAFSFIFEGLAEYKKQHTFQFAQQMTRAVVIILFVSYLYITLI
ncbi:hypothetical protein [Sediminibacillus albus]|uniref:Uncharacterized protein n=1 Tax=Sediminibacillus albus TaxID=407036 RepID=A0A1G8ZMS6_9BACI|nr:hypothetical protein [Sediminibacillus albus]SDK16313.1 hypothetical protein SAMN05216243_2111 [Sediminibacillus albus]